ncbi:Hypothetical predicted protein [Paramuricea clavata]|nr:Hypothetical predicted protein [Paramuricea clavata]
MMPSAIPNENTAVAKFGAQQQFDKNGQESHDDKSHQDELSEAATRSGQTSSNHSILVPSSYMATKGKDEAMYPVINNVRTLQVPRHGIKQQGDLMSTVVYSMPSERSGQIKNSPAQPAYNGQTSSLRNTQIVPQRPQDLLDNISMDVAQANVKSSAQYRKSYAFKIWRDKGSFPYRLAEQPVVKEVVQRKKSKKCLNAIRAQKDREKEDAWKEFKSCRDTNNEMKHRRISKFPHNIRVEGTSMKHHDEGQLDTILSDSQDNNPKSSHTRHQNSIPDYFKNKKESAQKSQRLASPTKSIPASVIHVHTTKACQVSKLTTQAEQSMITSDNGHGVYNVLKSTAQTTVLLESSPTSKGNLVLGNKDNGIFQRSDTQASSNGKCNIHVQGQEHVQLNPNAVNDRQKITETISGSVADSSCHIKGRNYVPDIQGKQQEDRSGKPHTSRSLSTTSYILADNSVKRREDIEILSTERNVISDQSLSPSQMQEANSEIDNSNLASIIKNSLAKKYSKENVKPDLGFAAVERGRKRVRNEVPSSEEGERQRRRTKQQKATMFTRLDEAVATNLADGIHNVNSEYFPIEALANKAAKETSTGASDGMERKMPKTSIKHKVDEIERAR